MGYSPRVKSLQSSYTGFGRDCVKSLRSSYTGFGRDCVKSLRSSYTGLYPQKLENALSHPLE